MSFLICAESCGDVWIASRDMPLLRIILHTLPGKRPGYNISEAYLKPEFVIVNMVEIMAAQITGSNVDAIIIKKTCQIDAWIACYCLFTLAKSTYSYRPNIVR